MEEGGASVGPMPPGNMIEDIPLLIGEGRHAFSGYLVQNAIDLIQD